MKRTLLLSVLMLFTAYGTMWAQPSLSGCRHITDLSQIKEGAYYYIVSDRKLFKTEDVFTAAMTTQTNTGYSWDSGDRKFVYWAELKMSNDSYLWKAEKVGSSQWAFQNAENSLYLGVMHKQHPYGTSSSETDMTFLDTPVGFTLTDLGESFSFTNSAITEPLNVHHYKSFTSRTVCATSGFNDAQATDAETNGYPGRWHLYELTGASALEDGGIYYMVNDIKPSACAKGTALPQAASAYINASIHQREWGESYVYWGDFFPEHDGYTFQAVKNGAKWALKNTKNGKYIGNEYEPTFSDTPVYFFLTDLTPDANRFYVQPVGDTRGLNLQGYAAHYNSCLNLVAEEGNETNGYNTRWHFIRVEDYMQQVAEDNAGTNTITEIYASGTEGGTNIMGPTGNVKNLVLTDGVAFEPAKRFTATNATYTRNVSNNWATISLPYAVSSNEDVTYYTAGTINGDVLTLTSATDVPAGTPAICKFNTAGNNTITATDVTVATAVQAESVTTDAITLVGSYTQTAIDDVTTDAANDYYYISNNKFWHATKKLTINPFRAYFTIAKSAAPSNGFSIAVDDDNLTAISALTGESEISVEAIYTVDGKKLSDLQQGLNIVKLSNGKTQKILIR